jgi:hypothetical protein
VAATPLFCLRVPTRCCCPKHSTTTPLRAPRRRNAVPQKRPPAAALPYPPSKTTCPLSECGGRDTAFLPSGRDPMLLPEAFYNDTAPRPSPSQRRPPRAASCGRIPISPLKNDVPLWECGGHDAAFLPSGRDPMLLPEAFYNDTAPRPSPSRRRPPRAASCGRTPIPPSPPPASANASMVLSAARPHAGRPTCLA